MFMKDGIKYIEWLEAQVPYLVPLFPTKSTIFKWKCTLVKNNKEVLALDKIRTHACVAGLKINKQ